MLKHSVMTIYVTIFSVYQSYIFVVNFLMLLKCTVAYKQYCVEIIYFYIVILLMRVVDPPMPYLNV